MRFCRNQPTEVWETRVEHELASEALQEILTTFQVLEEQDYMLEAVRVHYADFGWIGTLYASTLGMQDG